ncbi:MAG: ABC transporter ATP-binding protein [Myxococcota bacterium]
MTSVHDFAGVAKRTTSQDRWLALGGPSGSGKSTLANWLLDTHPAWEGPHLRIEARPLDFGPARALEAPHIVFIDEVVDLGQLAQAMRLSWQGHRLLIATHLPRWALAILGPKGRFISTRINAESKITRELTRRELRVTPQAVRAYLRAFGPVYPEIDIVLERCPGGDFDRSLGRFLKFHRVERSRNLS